MGLGCNQCMAIGAKGICCCCWSVRKALGLLMNHGCNGNINKSLFQLALKKPVWNVPNSVNTPALSECVTPAVTWHTSGCSMHHRSVCEPRGMGGCSWVVWGPYGLSVCMWKRVWGMKIGVLFISRRQFISWWHNKCEILRPNTTLLMTVSGTAISRAVC